MRPRHRNWRERLPRHPANDSESSRYADQTRLPPGCFQALFLPSLLSTSFHAHWHFENTSCSHLVHGPFDSDSDFDFDTEPFQRCDKGRLERAEPMPSQSKYLENVSSPGVTTGPCRLCKGSSCRESSSEKLLSHVSPACSAAGPPRLGRVVFFVDFGV